MALLALIFVICATTTALTLEMTPFFRKDYQYNAALKTFYKIHHSYSWDEAREICEAEGASLSYPDNQEELEYIITKSRFPFDFWVGAHDNFVSGEYVTLKGENLKYKWAPLYPGYSHETRTGKQCVTLGGKSKTVFLSECWHNKSAVCSKRIHEFTYNQPCQTYDPAYEPSPEKTKCYKMHTEPKTWSQAYHVCQMEEANLVVIENEYDKRFLRDLFAKSPSETINDNYNIERAFVGYKKMFDHWRSIHGNLVPSHLGNIERNDDGECGSVDRQGSIRAASCEDSKFFICERKIESHKMIAVFLDEEEMIQKDVKDETKIGLTNRISNPSSTTMIPYSYDTNDDE